MSWFGHAVDIVMQQRDVETFGDGMIFVLGQVVPVAILVCFITGFQWLKRKIWPT